MSNRSTIWLVSVKLGISNQDQLLGEVMIKDYQGDLSPSLLDFNKAILSDSNTGVRMNIIPNGSNNGVDIDV